MKVINCLIILAVSFCMFLKKIYINKVVKSNKLNKSKNLVKKRGNRIIIKRYIRHKFRFGGGYRFDFRTGKLKFFSCKIKYIKNDFKNLVKSFNEEYEESLSSYNITWKQAEHPTFYHLDKENRRLIKFHKTHSKKIYNEQINSYEKTIYIGKGEDGRREYMTNIQQHKLDDKNVAIAIRDIIAEGEAIDFEIPRLIEQDLVSLGIPIKEIRKSNFNYEIDKWSEMLAKWDD